MDCSTPGFPVLHRLPELAQTHVHWVRDAIQPSHPLSTSPNYREGAQPHLSAENWIIGLKIYWTWSWSPEQDPVFPTASPAVRKLAQSSHPHPSDSRQNENHNYRKIIKLINWTTAFSSSVKPWAMPCRITQDRWVMVENSDKVWSTGEGNGKPLQYSCLENPMNSMKRQKDKTLKDELPRSVGTQYYTRQKWRYNSRKNEHTEPK